VKQLLLACLSFAAATSAAQSPYAQSPYDPIPRADLQSPLIQRLLSSPLGDERAANRAQALLVLSDNHNEGETLRLFLQRRALKHVLGESFEFSGSVAEAVAAEKTDPEKFRSLVERALETVAIEYARRKPCRRNLHPRRNTSATGSGWRRTLMNGMSFTCRS
jgi:hypothetical protein